MKVLRLSSLRASLPALLLAVVAWAAGCGTAKPMIEPTFQARTYTPARVALLPPDVFFVYDEFGDNDPAKSAALGQALSQQTLALVTSLLERRGYQVDLSARWDGVHGPDGQILIPRDELGFYANSVLSFVNSEEGGGSGKIERPIFIAPETAARLGWATQSDALLYVNLKGVSVSSGKRTAQVLGAVFFVVVIAAIVLLIFADSKGGGRSGGKALAGNGGRGGGVSRAAAPASAPGATRARWGSPATAAPSSPPIGRGRMNFAGGGGRTYRHSRSSNVSVGVGVLVPLGGPVHTHEGQVADEDETFAGDDLNFSMTLVSASDGRVLWHLRESADVDAEKPEDVERFFSRVLDQLPPSLAVAPPGPVNGGGKAAPRAPVEGAGATKAAAPQAPAVAPAP